MTDETQVEAGETNETGEAQVTAQPQESGDPLDAITSLDELRNKAKGYRSERNDWRTKFKENTNPSPLDRPLTRGEVVKDNEQRGFNTTSEFIRSNKEKLLPHYNANYGGSIPTPEEVAERWKDAEAAFLRRNPQAQPDAALDLQTDTGTIPAGTPMVKEKKEPLMGDKTGPESWFQ